MKKPTKIILKLLNLIVLLILFGCEKDLYDDKIYQDGINKKKITLNEFKSQHPLAFSKFQNVEADYKKAKMKKGNLNGKLVYDSNLGFFIDTDKIVYMEKNGYKSYTFPIKREYEEEKLENMILAFSDIDSYKSYISKYDFTSTEIEMLKAGIELADYYQKMVLEDFEGNVYINNGVFSRIVKMENGICYVVNHVYADGSYDWIPCPGCCDGMDEGGGGGGGGDSSGNSSGGAWSDGTTVSGNPWYGDSSTFPNSGDPNANQGNGSTEYGGGGTYSSGSNNPNNPNNSTTTPTSPHQPGYHQLGYINPHTGILTVPCVPAEDDGDIETLPCRKIINQLQSNSEILTEIQSMANKTGENTEWGRYKVTSANVIQTPPSDTNGAVSFPVPPGSSQYTFMAHTHNSPADITYSVFSWADINALGQMIKNNHIDNEHFVAYLATADGTYYALTIDDPDKLKQFFATKFNDYFDLNIALNREKLKARYFDPKMEGDAIIKENDTDLATDEKNMVKFLSEANMGMTLSESNSTFTNFQNLSYDKNNDKITKKNCNLL